MDHLPRRLALIAIALTLTLAGGEHLIVMGRPEGLRRLEQLLTGVPA